MNPFESIMHDLRDRNTIWYAQHILAVTVPKILSIAPYLNDYEVAAIMEQADKEAEVFTIVSIALSVHVEHKTRVTRMK